MSEFDRAFNIGRGYFDKAKDAIFGAASADAQASAELEQALTTEVIAAKAQEVQKAHVEELKSMTEEHAREILGLGAEANYSEIKSQHDKFLARITEFDKINPTRRQNADRERKRIGRAFVVLTKDIDSTEKRFGSLEIE